ncbi:hypothetical protein KNP414_00485 [Paenibacillus mucilaginosus KNP414]|uniref:Uncharacterized protein n=1 Tax=Paenibacillus mucilaginosus (strain KNP414) TaxID=1036673 RepID=F8FPW8_PAEMK|nr:hypothetical protein KNP414_00485 [Paenibacillus mucilaginosus KNP414]
MVYSKFLELKRTGFAGLLSSCIAAFPRAQVRLYRIRECGITVLVSCAASLEVL